MKKSIIKRIFGGKKLIWILLAAILLYLVLGAVLPFVKHPQITKRTKEILSERQFLSEKEGKERVRVLSDNGEALEERIRLISQAKERIILSTFEFRSDESGKDILAALLSAARRGVSVQVLTDGMPAFLRMTGNEYFQAIAEEENAEIRIYNPLTLLTPWKLMGRMHDKYLIADDSAYILGGRNTYDYFLGAHDGYKNYDWDVLVWNLEGDGSASFGELLSYFEEVWELPLCRPYHENENADSSKAGRAAAELAERYKRLESEHPDWLEPCDYRQKTRASNHIELVTNPIHCYSKEPVVFYTITELMAQAEREVRFHTPYIISSDWMLERLQNVCDHVPEVVMMTNSVANNGNPFGAMDYDKYKGRILETGVQILEYDGGVSYHGKCFVADDRLSGIGSFNWDMRSAYLDTEMMLIIDSTQVNADLRSAMKRYEEEALIVQDKKVSEAPAGMEAQELSTGKKIQFALMRFAAGWARFLM